MRTKNIYITSMLLSIWLSFVLTSCDVHEMPVLPEEVTSYFQLHFDTNMPIQDLVYETRAGTEEIDLDIRYIVNAYRLLDKGKTAQEYREQFIFTRSSADGYDCNFTLDLPPGKYKIMVWVDLVEQGSKANHFYNADNFAEIHLQGKHQANTDNRDAFRGSKEISLVADILEKTPDTNTIEMIRPLGKFEFITNDLKEFVVREVLRASNNSTEKMSGVNLDDYRVIFYYTGFMPNAFSLFTDKPVDSATKVYFESKLTQINDSEASMGFDYIFVNGKESIATVAIGIFNTAGEQLGMTAPIDVSIKRSYHTIMKGKFLLQKNTGGVNINPEFEDDHNIFFP